MEGIRSTSIRKRMCYGIAHKLLDLDSCMFIFTCLSAEHVANSYIFTHVNGHSFCSRMA